MSKAKSISSMPAKPLFRAKRFTRAVRRKLAGRWVAVGWLDSPPRYGVFVNHDYDGDGAIVTEGGTLLGIDTPQQILVIGEPAIASDAFVDSIPGLI